MCGIFGVVAGEKSGLSVPLIRELVAKLFILSESRGKEAAGLTIRANEQLHVYKEPRSASDMLVSAHYDELWRRKDLGMSQAVAVIGHSRLVTNGLQGISSNNQPVVKDGIVGVHNGIVVNDKEIWAAHPELRRDTEVDTEVVLALVRHFEQEYGELEKALQKVFSLLRGSASVALLFEDYPYLALATNTGSLYTIRSHGSDVFVFSSERYILQCFLEESGIEKHIGPCSIKQLLPGLGLLVSLQDADPFGYALAESEMKETGVRVGKDRPARIHDCSDDDEKRRRDIKRCTRCILPETFPMISFDENGVCNICRQHTPMDLLGEEALHDLAERHRSKDGSPDCVVAFSGGRDSSYMLHYIKKELNLNPVAYGYDWGMVTDIARRNQAIITGQLGVEYIVVSADIRQKRKNIQKNVLAWLKKPSLGMIPLFMAGDKQYFYYLEQVRKQLGVELAFLGGNPLEKTGFKTGFTGVQENITGRTYDISTARKVQIISYYLRQFISNPSYLNKSLYDTAHAFYSSYIMKHDFTWLFKYIQWQEPVIDKVLQEEYGWEVAKDTESTWRIGDGTASFYNYIYYTVAGFSENDTLRSNQIREGMSSREEALRVATRDNQPRYDSMREYAYQIGFDLDEALYLINSMPKLY